MPNHPTSGLTAADHQAHTAVKPAHAGTDAPASGVGAASFTERPILFSGPMIRAIIEGRKTQTRRIVDMRRGVGSAGLLTCAVESGVLGWITRAACDFFEGRDLWAIFEGQGHPGFVRRVRCPYGVTGDRLWVRENFRQAAGSDEVHYQADPDECSGGPWRPSIFMPRWASRLLLEVTDVRVQRLQQASADDIDAEGIDYETSEDWHEGERLQSAGSPVSPERYAFACLWNAINGKRAPWESNPWVWAITFKRLEAVKAADALIQRLGPVE